MFPFIRLSKYRPEICREIGVKHATVLNLATLLCLCRLHDIVRLHVNALWCHSTFFCNSLISRPVKLQTKKEEEEKKQITVKLCISSAYAVSLRLSQNYCEALRRWRQQQILTGDTHSIKGPPQHLLLTPKAASAIYATPEHCGYLLMLNEHGATAPPPSCNCGTNHQHAAAKVRQKVLRFISCHLFSARFKIDS